MTERYKHLIQRLETLRKRYCTGPCGQSASVLAQRDEASKTLREAMAAIKFLQDEVARLERSQHARS